MDGKKLGKGIFRVKKKKNETTENRMLNLRVDVKQHCANVIPERMGTNRNFAGSVVK